MAKQALKEELDKAERQKKADQAAAAERKRKAEREAEAETERKKKEEHDKAEAERRQQKEGKGQRRDEEDEIIEDIDISPLEIPPSGTRSILSGDDFPGEQEEEVFDLTRLKFDQFSFKIQQEKRKSLAQSHPAISTVATEKDIVLDTRTNPVMIEIGRAHV